eukprot:3726052-Rhodomonas_salina.3
MNAVLQMCHDVSRGAVLLATGHPLPFGHRCPKTLSSARDLIVLRYCCSVQVGIIGNRGSGYHWELAECNEHAEHYRHPCLQARTKSAWTERHGQEQSASPWQSLKACPYVLAISRRLSTKRTAACRKRLLNQHSWSHPAADVHHKIQRAESTNLVATTEELLLVHERWEA